MIDGDGCESKNPETKGNSAPALYIMNSFKEDYAKLV